MSGINSKVRVILLRWGIPPWSVRGTKKPRWLGGAGIVGDWLGVSQLAIGALFHFLLIPPSTGELVSFQLGHRYLGRYGVG